jgi:hypothetical protein
MLAIGVEVVTEGFRLVTGSEIFGSSYDVGLDQLGAAFEVAQHAPGGSFITAARGHGLHDTSAIPILGDVVRGFDDDALAPAFPYGQRRRAELSAAIFPASQTFALADEDFGPRR